MAFEEYDDYEQEQLVKEWLKNNALTIVLGIALGIGGLYGYGKWESSQIQKSQEGAVEFQHIADVLKLEETTEAESMIAEYEGKFGGDNLFAVKARMQLAGMLVEQEKLAEAKAQYQAVITNKPGKAVAELAHLRLARLMVSLGELDQAAEQLKSVQSAAYKTVVEEIKGDIFVAKGDLSMAKDAYQLALNEGEGYSGRQIVEMKLTDVQ